MQNNVINIVFLAINILLHFSYTIDSSFLDLCRDRFSPISILLYTQSLPYTSISHRSQDPLPPPTPYPVISVVDSRSSEDSKTLVLARRSSSDKVLIRPSSSLLPRAFLVLLLSIINSILLMDYATEQSFLPHANLTTGWVLPHTISNFLFFIPILSFLPLCIQWPCAPLSLIGA